MNQQRSVSWKGRTFNQVVAGLKMNTNTFSTTSSQGFFLAPPIKHYRREIANINVCSTRANVDGDAFFQPGGTIVNTSTKGYTAEFNLTESLSYRPSGKCDSVACSKTADAKRRVRSSGNVKRKFTASNDTYYTSTNEYLISRNRTVKQNEYVYVRYGDPSYKPGSSGSIPNIYAPNGINHCAKVFIGGYATSPLFQYQWIDGIVYNFTIANGNYDMGELNSLFKKTLAERFHYYIDTYSDSKVFLFNFVYDTLSSKVQIQCFATDRTIVHPDSRYTRPNEFVSWVKPDYTIVPVIRILANGFQSILGITAGNYPPADISGNTVGARNQTQPAIRLGSPYATPSSNIYGPGGIEYRNLYLPVVVSAGNQFKTGTVNPTIGTPYVPLYYKPSNSKFASQGGVDSSARLTRLKYDTVTNSANTFMSAYGKQTANSLAYGVPGPGYTIKDKVGYPLVCSPVAKANGMLSCQSTKIGGG